MTSIQAVGTSVPEYAYRQGDVAQLVKKIFSVLPNLERYLPVFEHAAIEKRHFCMPLEWYADKRPFHEKNRLYQELSVFLGEQAARNCLKKTDLPPQEIDHLFFVSSTGIATPSIDAFLINRLGLSPHVKRTPIWGLGCAGGAVGLSRAFDYLRAHPDKHVLIVTVELCSLTFLQSDLSPRNLVAAALFADGAAAALMSGEEKGDAADGRQNPVAIVDTLSTLYPDSYDVMGWELHPEGLKVVFSRDIPAIVRNTVRENLNQLLSRNNLTLEGLSHFLLHPGGAKVLDAYRHVLELQPEHLAHSHSVLREFGNMSSSTVLFVLERFVEEEGRQEGYGILSALGPGFSSELLLFKTGKAKGAKESVPVLRRLAASAPAAAGGIASGQEKREMDPGKGRN